MIKCIGVKINFVINKITGIGVKNKFCDKQDEKASHRCVKNLSLINMMKGKGVKIDL